MPQTYGAINTGAGGDTVKAGIIALAARTDTLRSSFSGTTFPSGGVVGQHCYRTDTGIEYVLISTGPDVWSKVLTGTLAVADGGTGATTASGARTNLGLGTAAVLNNGTASSELPTISQADARYTQRGNNLSDLNSAVTARTNLGLGALATLASVGSAQIDSGAISTAAKISDGVVTYAKMQVASAASKLIGSPSSGTTLQEIGIGSGLTLSGSTLSTSATATAVGHVTSNITVTSSSTTLTGISFSIGANELWSFEITLSAESSASHDLNFNFTTPASVSWFLGTLTHSRGVSGSSGATYVDRSTSAGTYLVGVMLSTSTENVIKITGTIQNGANAGTVQLKALTDTSGETTTIHKGSYLVARKH